MCSMSTQVTAASIEALALCTWYVKEEEGSYNCRSSVVLGFTLQRRVGYMINLNFGVCVKDINRSFL